MSRQRARWMVLLGAGLLLSACAMLGTKPTEMQKLQARAAYERALVSIGERQASSALAALQEAIAVDPTVALYRDTLGQLLLELRQTGPASAEFRKAVELDPHYADAHFHLGTALAEMQRWEDAVASYRTAIGLPRLTVPDLVHQNLGLALYHLKRYREAEQALRYAISLDPEMQAAYYNLGLLFVAEKRTEEAKAAFRHTRQLGPDSPFGQAAQERLKALGEGG